MTGTIPFSVRGKVLALLADGFQLTRLGGARIEIRTQAVGPPAGLAEGDMVEVLGGPDPDRPGVFRASAVYRMVGERRGDRIPDRPDHPRPWR